MNKYPAKPIADELASHGRHGDTMLVHMNPIEVRGIAALTPRGLTTNPVTGQLEAYNLMETLLPMLGSAAAVALMPAMAPALAGGIGSGLTTAALTGDLERGLLSGAIGAGTGAAFGAAGGNASADAVTTMAPEASTALGSTVLADSAQTIVPPLADPQTLLPDTGMMNASFDATPQAPFFDTKNFADNFSRPFQDPKLLGKELMKPRTMIPAAIASGEYAALDQQDAWDAEAKELEGDSEAKLQAAYADIQSGYRAAQPNAQMGLSPYRSQMSRRTPLPGGYAQGGMVKYRDGGRTGPDRGAEYYDYEDRYRRRGDEGIGEGRMGGVANPGAPNGIFGIGAYGDNYAGYIPGGGMGGHRNGYGGIDPVTVQQNLRGRHSVAPPRNYMPGFNPEFSYFQDDPDNIQVPDLRYSGGWQSMYRQNPLKSSGENTPFFESVLAGQNKADDKGITKIPKTKPPKLAEGGSVMLQTDRGPVGVPAGGIANLETSMTQPPEVPTKLDERDVQMLAAALMGQAGEQADQIVDMFIQKYGPDMFREVRDMILQSSVAGNAQTEGMIQGQGGGMDDQVTGMIDGQQPVAVSSGEFIVPADVVSGLGDGSSDAGAQELEGMMNNVRRARQGGSLKQPAPIDAKRVLPR